MHDSNLGAMLRNKIMTDDVDADDLTLKVVTAGAIKYYGTWRTYDNALSTGTADKPGPKGQHSTGAARSSGTSPQQRG